METTIMENQMGKNMEDAMEPGLILGKRFCTTGEPNETPNG